MLNSIRFIWFSSPRLQLYVEQHLQSFNTSSLVASTDTNRSESMNNTVRSPPEDDLDILYKSIVVEVRGHDKSVLDSYQKFVEYTSEQLDLELVKVKQPERFIERWSILKSAFVHKKHFRQYESRTHFRQFYFKHLTGSTSDTLLEYIQRNIPEGVSMYVHRTEMRPLDDNLKPP
jgi:small subunit ribosomal protein S10